MAQQKVNCKNCRRLIGIDMPSCPFCGTGNPNYEQNRQKSSEEHSNPQDILSSRTAKHSNEETTVQNTGTEISVEDIEALYKKPIPIKGKSDISISPKVSEDTVSIPDETDIISSVEESHRAHIPWSDEKKQTSPCNFTDMFNENGIYQANYDGYYNDTLPKIQNEIDNILLGKEKTILKAVFSVVGIIAVIIYLVLTN